MRLERKHLRRTGECRIACEIKTKADTIKWFDTLESSTHTFVEEHTKNVERKMRPRLQIRVYTKSLQSCNQTNNAHLAHADTHFSSLLAALCVHLSLYIRSLAICSNSNMQHFPFGNGTFFCIELHIERATKISDKTEYNQQIGYSWNKNKHLDIHLILGRRIFKMEAKQAK